MHILVTGGAGFIGSNLCDHLIGAKHQVVCVDNLITGSEKNIGHLLSNPSFSFIKADIADKINFKEKFDAIFHLASPASPIDYQNHPVETMIANSQGTHKMLNLAKNLNAKFLLASTSEVYGDPQEHPQKETYWGNVNPIGERSCYDESKRYAESLTMVYVRKFNLDARIVRIFNTYGPRLQRDDGRVISNFINQALHGQSLTIYGDGNQTRSFCYVSDMVKGLVMAMNKEQTKGEVFNLGNPEEFTILQIAQMVKELINPVVEFINKPLPQDDPRCRQPDISKARQVLGWQPQVPFKDGIIATIEYFKSNA
ncbi:SDR family oxidoreductase [Candidatus Daviesbacteria bacterium]|nr:SDR family oxidoreductase [Candidatus Daviesbacteria bacterium]